MTRLPLAVCSEIMTTLFYLPLSVITAALLIGNTGNETSLEPRLHPHHHKISEIACIQGKVKVQWFTVPFNAQQVAKNQRANYLWSRGFSLQTDVALLCGDIKVPAGNYGLAFQLDGQAKNWNTVLIPQALVQLQSQLRSAKRRGRATEEIEAKLAATTKSGITSLTLTNQKFEGKHAEHMALSAINYGYPIVNRRDSSPTSGVKGEFRVSFGDLHTSFAFQEVFQAPKKK